jgi:probable HAF family extracellular repeat protein
MRSLGSPGGTSEFLIATGVNTHRRVVGITFPTGPVVDLPFLWMPGGGIQQLPTLGGPNGVAWDINEFGQIVGTSWTAGNRIRATLWTPTAGPLAVSPAGEVAPAGMLAR